MSVLDDLIESTDITLQQILNNLLDSSKDLSLKTHIFKPKQLASLKILSNYLKTIKLKKSSLLLQDFIKVFLEYMISYKRLSRIEIIRALSNLKDDSENLTTAKKLTTTK